VNAFDRAVNDVINNPFEAYLISEPYIENLPMNDDFRDALIFAATAQDAINERYDETTTLEAIAANREMLFEQIAADFEPDLTLQLQVLMETVRLWEAERTGFADLSSWEVTQDTLLQMGFVDEGIDLEAAYTNEFLP
ncbi:MAG: hypothetical protein AAGK74_12530, partial [Chloroflexota bacterium]